MDSPSLPLTGRGALGASRRDRRLATTLGAAAILVFAVAMGTLLYQAQFSPSLRWVLGVAFLAAMAVFGCVLLLRRTGEPAPLVGPAPPRGVRTGELDALAAAVRRASRGLAFSQVVVASRARAAFVERVRLALGLSPEAMGDAQRDPVRLRRILHDPVLADFVHQRVGDLDERYRWAVEARARRGFAREFEAVLARMEAWR